MTHYVEWLAPYPRAPRTGVAYVGVRVLVYLIGLVLMVLVYGTKQRGLIIAPPVALVGAAGTWYLLGDTPLQTQRRLINAAGVGLLLAELTWALGYWDVSGAGLVGGASLWLAFYVLSGITEHAASLTLDRRIGIEYALVALVGTLGILWSAHPWSS
jgi:Protein of unknown function (DUF5656)